MEDDISRAGSAKTGTPFLTTDQAARYVGLSRPALEKMRRKGRGPRFRKHGRYVRYHIADLDAWSGEHLHNSTKEPDGPSSTQRSDGGADHA